MSIRHSRRFLLLPLFGAAFLGGCSFIPEYQRPAMPVPDIVGSSDERGSVNGTSPSVFTETALMGWRNFFTDPHLQKLIEISLQNNRDLRMAVLKVSEARAMYSVQDADRYPQLNAEGSASIRGGREQPISREYSAAAAPGFELDFFGRLKSLSVSAMENYLATREARRTAHILLVSQVAQSYLEQRLAEEQLSLAKRTQASRAQSYKFIEQRIQSGQSSILELEQARSLVEAAAAAQASRQRQLLQANNALSLLLGNFEPGALPVRTSLERQSFVHLPGALPSSVLLLRPDVMEAEHQLLAANADIGAARAAFFPTIALTGEVGYASDALSGLFSGATTVWSFLPKISIPIFSAGRNQANLDLAEIRKENAVAQYEKVIQTAFRETADALQSRATYAAQLAAQRRYLQSQRRVLDLAQNRYTNGVISYLEVLDAQRGVFEAEQELLNIRQEQLVNEIVLFRALGGGWIEETGKLPPSDPTKP